VHWTLGRALAAGAAILALAAPAVAAAGSADTSRVASTGGAAAAGWARDESLPAGTSQAAGPGRGAAPSRLAAGHVVLVGIGGLRWSDVSPTTTPALWRLAGEGSAGSLVVSGIHPRTCPADGWLTLNAAARAAVPHAAVGPCPADPPVTVQPSRARAGTPSPARVSLLPRLVTYNAQFHYNPQWGLLATAPGPGRCATAVGPGAALALASRSGQVASYLPSPAGLRAATLARCPLTVVDLGNLPTAPGPAGQSARAAAARVADRQLGRIIAGLPADTTLLVAAPGDGPEPHLRVIVVNGPRYASGLLTAASTRQPRMVTLTDLTPTVLGLLGTPAPSAVVGSPLLAAHRAEPGGLAATVRTLTAHDVAAQVYRHTVTPFYQLVGFGYPALFALIAVIPWARGSRRGPRRRAVARTVGAWAASVPAGTFLASLVPWWTLAHPAVVLYSLAVAWAAVVAAAALAGPWRRDPLGPPGVVAAVTLGVIGLDLITGTHLARETPFGLHVLEAGRFYGLGNNAVVIYGASGILCAAWLGGVLLRRGQRSKALLVMAAVTAFTVVVAAWPGFGAKVGGTIAMLPGFLVLLAAAANMRITWRRAALAALSGLALVTVFALVNYFVPATGQSDIGGFVGQVLHGGADATLQRKISSNVGSLTANPFVLVIPVVVAVLGAIVAWPARLRCTLLVRAYRQIPLLQPALSAVWLIAVLSWFAEDSGVTVPAAALPLVLPLMVVILSSLPAEDEGRAAAEGQAAPAGLEGVSGRAHGPAAGDPPLQAGDGARSGPGAARLSLGHVLRTHAIARAGDPRAGDLRDMPGMRPRADTGSGW
jgi:hypothetical protein